MHPTVLAALRCPICQEPFINIDPFTCANNHSFDRARQGYVNLLAGRDPGTGDTADMVTRRAAFLAGGHYDPIADALPTSPGVITEIGAGTGYYISRVLDRSPAAHGLALDVSKYAARRAAQAHPRAEAAVADCWNRLPLADASVDLLLDVFAPRNVTEFARVLTPTGLLAVVTPLPEHLAEIRTPLGMLDVEENKTERLRESLASAFTEQSETHIRYTMALTRTELADLVGMGPSARHTNPAERINAMAEPVTVSVGVRLGLYTVRL